MTTLVRLRRAPRRDRAPTPARALALTIDGRPAEVPEGTTVLDAARALGIEIPTLCFLESVRPASACRLCVVEVEGARALVPACSRAAEPGMVVWTRSERVVRARRVVLELLASSVDLSATPRVAGWMAEYGCAPARFAGALPGRGRGQAAARPPALDNELFVRDLAKCVLCYRCVSACGADHQNSFAIAVAGRGFGAHVSTERGVALPGSACVFCGNCVAVCPTGALMVRTEYDGRAAGTWDEARQTRTDTICPYCGVGCTLRLHVQDGAIVKVTSPPEHPVAEGNLCVKGRFGWRFVHSVAMPMRAVSPTAGMDGAGMDAAGRIPRD